MNYSSVQDIVLGANTIVVLQADNPDGDSLGSALALEAIFSEMGKRVVLVCAVDIPAHLRYLSGWDRVVKEVPNQFDATVIVDTSSETLFENETMGLSWVKAKPSIVLDHHGETQGISFATVTVNEPVVATGELIYKIAKDLEWPLPLDACEFITSAIMSDSLGLTTDATTPETFSIMAELVKSGVDIPKLDQARRELMNKEPELISYKGELLQRIVFSLGGAIARIDIPWKEIEYYSPMYNPTMLVIDDMRMTKGVRIAIGYKIYTDGKITAKIRCNYGYGVAANIAKKFGGGGHPYAAGFKTNTYSSVDELHKAVEKIAEPLLSEIEHEIT